MKTLDRPEWVLLICILIYSFIPTFGGLIRVVELAGGPAIAPQNFRALADPMPLVIHVLSSFVFCIAGAFQFLPSIRQSHPNIHRGIGVAVAISGCMSAASGLWMTHYYAFPQALQGSLLYWVRMVLGTLMIGFIIQAVVAIRARKVVLHSAAMLRAYAIGQGASTQTFLGLMWIVIFGAESTGLVRDVMMVLGWAANLFVAEVVIRRALCQRRPSLRL